MSTTMNDMPETAAAAVSEASRIAAQAARRGTETATASIEPARTYVRQTSTFGRDMLATWSTHREGALKAAFDAQNAAFDAGLGLFDLGVKGNREAIAQFSSLVKQTQKATLDSWQTAVKAAAKVTEPAKR